MRKQTRNDGFNPPDANAAKRSYGGKWLGSVLEAVVPKEGKNGPIPGMYQTIYAETYKKWKVPQTPHDHVMVAKAELKRKRRRERNLGLK